MLEKQLVITNRLGLHARPAALLAQTAGKFKSEVRLIKDGIETNAKSVMGLMMLAAESGCRVVLKIWGEDEQKAMEALERVFMEKFHEE